ncbi:MAG: tRNA 4-thiouridine(8) synthase ThiI [Gammaproteobacteria bacterium]|nr:MAG: tRNA 4-thiouridine(8) synthase ThiI [Gammaproteobacteria bacterium]PCJ49922.1 MAG: tRNA 4-thiouridine(8) synthase ThiI [Gammaproteobacteria bacterium]
MKLIIKLFPEIIIKSRSLRKNMTMRLCNNIRNTCRDIDTTISVRNMWDKLEVNIDGANEQQRKEIIERLGCTPGIDKIEEVIRHQFETLDDLGKLVVKHNAHLIKGGTFCVRAKRSGKHPFKSFQAEQELGGYLLRAVEDTSVDLHTPDITVRIAIKDQQVDLIEKIHPGIGGFPLGTQGSVLSLLSGGFDSGVASYMTMKRGYCTHFCFFNLGGAAHEVGVKQVADYLWRKYSYSHRVKFVTVPFEDVVEEILTKVHHSQMGVVLKRMMLRAANKVASRMKAGALVTGESLAQVSSQTLPNLTIIDEVAEHLVIRPLIVMDKLDIIKTAAKIGTEDFAKHMPEYCGVISDRPTSHAKKDRIEAEEANFDMTVLDQAVSDSEVVKIDEVLNSVKTLQDVEVVKIPTVDDIIIDIRHAHEEEASPLHLTNNEILKIPFFALTKKAPELDKDRRYLLYCDRGVMSQLQASQLADEGYSNILVYKNQ